MAKDKLISLRVNSEQLENLKVTFGLKGCFGADSKAIELRLNFTENVIRNLFGSNIKAVFTRNPKNINLSKY